MSQQVMIKANSSDKGSNKLLWLVFNLSSRAFGWFAAKEWPQPVQQAILKVYCAAFKVNMAEAEKPISEYRSLIDLFIRKLKSNARDICGKLVSPADGTLRSIELVEQGTLTQVKGKTYKISDLIDSERHDFSQGFSYNFYLSPKDYHRLHAPIDCIVKKVTYIPGLLYPVNKLAFKFVPKLFVQNERVILELQTSAGEQAAFVLVGAMNVGKIKLTFLDLSTNSSYGTAKQVFDNLNIELSAGQELGRFELGSACVLLLDNNLALRLNANANFPAGAVKMGQSLI